MAEHCTIDLIDENDKLIDEDASNWTSERVRQWFRANDFVKFESVLSNHPINGLTLLSLTRNSLQQYPFQMTNSNDLDDFLAAIETLRKEQLSKYMRAIHQKGIRNGFCNGALDHNIGAHRQDNDPSFFTELSLDTGTMNYPEDTTHLLSGSAASRTSTPASDERYPSEKMKALLSFFYMIFGFVVSVFAIHLTHERVPPMDVDPPLPDLFFDAVPTRSESAFIVCESAGIILVVLCLIIFLFHKHRFIIARRVFCILGTLYLYRSCTMYVTTLPVPGLHFKCAPKTGGKISLLLASTARVLYGGGLTITGAHNLCGDYLFSGHTIILITTYLVITEYSPKRWWFLHWISWLLAAVGIVCILLAHDHYSVDVVVAYLLTTRLFWSYHTLCNVQDLRHYSDSNLLSRSWWFPLFRFFEGNVSTNGRLPRRYEWPLPWPRRFRPSMGLKRSPIKGV